MLGSALEDPGQAHSADQDRRGPRLSGRRLRVAGQACAAMPIRQDGRGARRRHRDAATRARCSGSGHVAMTIDPGGRQGYATRASWPSSASRWCEAAHTYFRQSEQLPDLHPAGRGAPLRPRRPAVAAPAWRWRAGGLLIQQLPRAGGKRSPLSDEARDASLEGEDDEDWNRTRHLAATVEDHEMLDPTLSPERLLYRLFHEEGVRVTPSTPVAAVCRCSRERIQLFLERFGPTSWPTCAKRTVPLPSPASSARANTALRQVRSARPAAQPRSAGSRAVANRSRPCPASWRLRLESDLIAALEFQDLSGLIAGGDLEAQPGDDLAYLRDLLGVTARELAGADP